jgi:hypothetical protein
MAALVYRGGLSLPGNPARPNEDAFCHADRLAAVFDGATGLGEPILPVDSDAAWIARCGAEGMIAHQADGRSLRAVLRLTVEEVERRFLALRLRVPRETYEIPFASMCCAGLCDAGLDVLWFGDCAALLRRPGEAAVLIGDAFARRAAEARRVARLAQSENLSATGTQVRAQFLPALRAARNLVNTRAGSWLFSPDAACAAHVAQARVAAPPGTVVLLASDGFLALACDYRRYDGDGLLSAAQTKGLRALYDELRAIENDDAQGIRFPRFKRSDDATALLLEVAAAQVTAS